jgi:transcriptional regulator NrdR family protein
MAKTGDKCEKCNGGRLRIASSARACEGKYQVQRLECNSCGRAHADLNVVLAESVRRRKFD